MSQGTVATNIYLIPKIIIGTYYFEAATLNLGSVNLNGKTTETFLSLASN